MQAGMHLSSWTVGEYGKRRAVAHASWRRSGGRAFGRESRQMVRYHVSWAPWLRGAERKTSVGPHRRLRCGGIQGAGFSGWRDANPALPALCGTVQEAQGW
jgi:hypothetical protein